MGLFDFLKPKNKGIENTKFYSAQFQNEVCALALWKLEENKLNTSVAVSELKKVGLSDEQVEYILERTKKFLEKEKPHDQQNSGIEETKFYDKQFQTEILAYAQQTYFQNKHSYEVVTKSLVDKGLNHAQVSDMILKLTKLNADMVDDFQQKLDSGEISDIKIHPNPNYKKGTVEADQVDRYIAYGAYQMDRDDLDNALSLFDKAIELDERATLAYANKGTLYSKKGDQEKALLFYSKALEIEPNHVDILETKMDLQFEMVNKNNEDEFIDTVKTLLQNDPGHPNALIYIIQFYLKQNDIESTLKSVKMLFGGYHTENITIQLLLDIFHKLPQERALDEFETFKITLGDDAKYQLGYCKGLYLKGIRRFDEAIEVYNQLNQVKEFSWNYYQMAIMKNQQNKTNEALQLLEATFKLEPGLKNDAKQFPELKNLWTDPRFIELTN